MSRLDYKDFEPKFGKWAEKFKPFIEGEEMYKIFEKLKEDSKKEIICPESSNTFRAFSASDPDNVHVVWYLMDPYPRRYKDKKLQATGIPMDCSNSADGRLQPSLQLFYEGIKEDMHYREVDQSPSLQYLLDQGVLLMNTDLTCKLNKTNSHEGLWAPFQRFFLEEIMAKKSGIIYVLSGKVSHAMEKYIYPIGNYIIKTEHPAAGTHKNMEWKHDNVFSKVDNILRTNGKKVIEWNKAYYDLPF